MDLARGKGREGKGVLCGYAGLGGFYILYTTYYYILPLMASNVCVHIFSASIHIYIHLCVYVDIHMNTPIQPHCVCVSTYTDASGAPSEPRRTSP